MNAAHDLQNPTAIPGAAATVAGDEDGELARRWQGGDRAAGAVLIDRHLPRMRGFLSARCGNPTEADDLAQEVFLSLCRNLSSYDRHLAFTGWLYGIARHKLADHWRRQRPVEVFEPRHEGTDHRSPDFIQQQTENAAAAWKEVFARLPEAQASALWLRVQEELSVEEIACAMEISLANAKVLLFRARQTLTPFFKDRVRTP